MRGRQGKPWSQNPFRPYSGETQRAYRPTGWRPTSAPRPHQERARQRCRTPRSCRTQEAGSGSASGLALPMDKMVLEHQRVEVGVLKGVHGVLRRADDRFLYVERSIQKKRNSRDLSKFFDELPVSRIGLFDDHLWSGSTVDMHHGRNFLFVFVSDADHRDHKRIVMLDTENFPRVFFEDRRGERPKPFAKLDLVIQYLSHVRATRIGDKAACSQCTPAQFHTAVEPAYDRSLGDHLCEPREKHVIVQRFIFESCIVESGTALVVSEARSPIGVLHHKAARIAELLVPNHHRGTE